MFDCEQPGSPTRSPTMLHGDVLGRTPVGEKSTELIRGNFAENVLNHREARIVPCEVHRYVRTQAPEIRVVTGAVVVPILCLPESVGDWRLLLRLAVGDRAKYAWGAWRAPQCQMI